MHNKTIFLTLRIFSATGGIEKVCRIVGKVLYELSGSNTIIYSLYDNPVPAGKEYFPEAIYKGFNVNKIKFIYSSVRKGIKNNIVILSHINLLPVGYLIKLISSKTKLILFAHGIEVWNNLSQTKIKMLKKCDRILAVSNFTKQKLISQYGIDDDKCVVINNSIDPYMPQGNTNDYKLSLEKKYGLTANNFILLTVTRIAADEKYKGHDKVIESLNVVIKEFPDVRYIIVGKYDLSEKLRLDKLIEKYDLSHAVLFTGFVPDNELPAYYTFSDVFIMPSSGEGFGISFIEAMYYGLPVIAGNLDGSVDALCNGKLGLLVNPHNVQEIILALKKVIGNKAFYKPDQNILMQNFSYQVYKQKIANILNFNNPNALN